MTAKSDRRALARSLRRETGIDWTASHKLARRIVRDDLLTEVRESSAALEGASVELEPYDCTRHHPCGYEAYVVGPRGRTRVFPGSPETEVE